MGRIQLRVLATYAINFRYTFGIHSVYVRRDRVTDPVGCTVPSPLATSGKATQEALLLAFVVRLELWPRERFLGRFRGLIAIKTLSSTRHVLGYVEHAPNVPGAGNIVRSAPRWHRWWTLPPLKILDRIAINTA